jgi:hypothetical protein
VHGLPFSRKPAVFYLGLDEERMREAVMRFLEYFTGERVYPAHYREFKLSDLRVRYNTPMVNGGASDEQNSGVAGG